MKKEKSVTAIYLAKLRDMKDWTQKDLDFKAGLPTGTVAGLESGAKPFSDSRLGKLAAVLGATVKDLELGGVAPISHDRREAQRTLDELPESDMLEVRLMLNKWKESAALKRPFETF